MASKIAKIILIVAGAVLLLWFSIPFLFNVSLNYGNVTGIIVGLLLLLYGIFLKQANKVIKSIWQKTIGKIVELIIAVILAAIIVLACATTFCMVNVKYAEPDSNLTVIVLGCKINGTSPSLMMEERLEAALEYLEKNPESNVIVSGGQGANEVTSEASVMKEWLLEHGISEERITMEEVSTDTNENLTNCALIIAASNSSDLSFNVGIVTNEFHEYRALNYAEDAGLTPCAIKADTAWWLFPTFWVREMYGILEYWFLV